MPTKKKVLRTLVNIGESCREASQRAACGPLQKEMTPWPENEATSRRSPPDRRHLCDRTAIRKWCEDLSGSFVPLPHTDRPFSCDEFLHVIAVGSVAVEFLLVKQVGVEGRTRPSSSQNRRLKVWPVTSGLPVKTRAPLLFGFPPIRMGSPDASLPA
jgi:hypothetical protein